MGFGHHNLSFRMANCASLLSWWEGDTPTCLVYIFEHWIIHILTVLIIYWNRQMFFGAPIWNDGQAAEVGGNDVQFFCILIPSWPQVFGVGQWYLGFWCLMGCWLYFLHCILKFMAIPFTPQCWSKGCFLFTSWLMDCIRIDVVLLQIVLGHSLSVNKVVQRHPQLVFTQREFHNWMAEPLLALPYLLSGKTEILISQLPQLLDIRYFFATSFTSLTSFPNVNQKHLDCHNQIRGQEVQHDHPALQNFELTSSVSSHHKKEATWEITEAFRELSTHDEVTPDQV